MFCPNGQVLRRPNESEAAACLGILPDLDLDKLYDVAVVGAGPARSRRNAMSPAD